MTIRGNRRRPIALAVAAALGAGSMGWNGTPAFAQDEGLQEVTVTGSRIVRRDLSSPSPIVTVEAEAIETTANIGIEASLNELPQFVPSGTQYDTSNVTANATSSPGIASLNLRGLGANRTLVLIDGRRGQPANANLAIDVNTIPSAAIKSVEVITGGASAVYGADATAGVVNFVLRNDFEGLEIDARTGLTEMGDAGETSVSAAVGQNFADGRGNVFLGAEFARRSSAPRLGREFFDNGWADPDTLGWGLFTFDGYAPDANRPDQAVVDSLFPEYAPGSAKAGNVFFLNSDGSVFQQAGAVGYNGPLEYPWKVKRRTNGDLNGSFVDRWVTSPLERRSMFGKAEFKLTDSVTTYLQGSFASVKVNSLYAYNPAVQIWNASMPYDADHPVPDELAALLDSRPDPTANWNYERRLDYIGASWGENTNNVYQLTAGLKGTLPIRDWTWDAYYSTGQTTGNVYLGGHVSYERYKLIVTSPNYGAGFVRVGTYGQDVRCTSGLPVFDNFIPSEDCLDAITVKLKHLTELSQDIAEASVQGSLAELKAGDLRFAAGVTHRKNDFRFEPDPLTNNEAIIESAVGQFSTNNTYGQTKVSEVFLELLVPVLSELPAVKHLELELGGRYSDYNFAGNVFTWKSLVNWSVNNSLRFRGGFQRANRAPNTAELFQGGTVSTVGLATGDPCAADTTAEWGNVASNPNRLQVQALCRALIGNGTSYFDTNPGGPDGYIGPYGFFPTDNAIIAGNPNLKSEKASTWTAGFVLQSPFDHPLLRNFVVSADYYNIEITDAIAPQDILTSYQKCFNSDGASNPTYSINDPGGFCANILRDRVRGDRQAVRSPFINTGMLQTAGFDFGLSWRAALQDMGLRSVPGNFGVSVQATILDKFDTQVTPTSPIIENQGTFAEGGQFGWRLNTTLRYSVSDWNVNLMWRHLPSIHDASYARNPNTTIYGVNSYDIFDLFGGWDITGRLTVRAGVDNLFDRIPPVVGANPPLNANGGNTNAGFYDTLGRRYFIGLKARF
jgi:iron complex outermembrane receptor protein